MNLRSLADLRTAQAAAGNPYLEFLRSGSVSVGLYVVRAGEMDPQQPHAEDEVYVVLSGRARFTTGEETRYVATGDVIFVAAGVAHRFHDISADLDLVVVFAPPESG